MNKLLSIVIPVYKVEKFIDKCISSLIVPDGKQLQLLDIVVINDGTPDNSAVLAKDPEIRPNRLVRLYHLLPFRIYYAWFKMHAFCQRCIRFIRRKVKKFVKH